MNTSPILITRITVYTALISFLLFPLIYKHAYKRMARGIFIKKNKLSLEFTKTFCAVPHLVHLSGFVYMSIYFAMLAQHQHKQECRMMMGVAWSQ